MLGSHGRGLPMVRENEPKLDEMTHGWWTVDAER
jgi:hypothetical protein